jgi:hypothetical protein
MTWAAPAGKEFYEDISKAGSMCAWRADRQKYLCFLLFRADRTCGAADKNGEKPIEGRHSCSVCLTVSRSQGGFLLTRR